MIHDSTLHRIFKISELTRLIAGQLILINPKSVVNLACACRYLEEPALSTLWETQWSFHTLLKVLPQENLEVDCLDEGLTFEIVGDPPPEAWNRVRRYASWMRHVHVDGRRIFVNETFHKLLANSPAGGWFPALQHLAWFIPETNSAHTDLFFSPPPKRISISPASPQTGLTVPPDMSTAIASDISALPTSTLQSLAVNLRDCAESLTYFTDSLSSVVLRCGPSLTEFTSTVPLSDAAVNHLMQLPHLRTWHIRGPPPSYSASSLPLIFPPLVEFEIWEDAIRGWPSLFQRLNDGTPTMQCAVPLSKTKESLKSLTIINPLGITTDAYITSIIQIFRNLSTLNISNICREDPCVFRLNNEDITELAVALPRLESLSLGYPCFRNTCATTVACLLPLSVHCIELKTLQVHFNTTNIVNDLKNISEDFRLQKLHSPSKCSLLDLCVHRMPLTLDEPGFDTVVKGILDIFPSLVYFVGNDRVWNVLSERIRMAR